VVFVVKAAPTLRYWTTGATIPSLVNTSSPTPHNKSTCFNVLPTCIRALREASLSTGNNCSVLVSTFPCLRSV